MEGQPCLGFLWSHSVVLGHNWAFKKSLRDLKAKVYMCMWVPKSEDTFQYSSLRKSTRSVYNAVLSGVPSN